MAVEIPQKKELPEKELALADSKKVENLIGALKEDLGHLRSKNMAVEIPQKKESPEKELALADSRKVENLIGALKEKYDEAHFKEAVAILVEGAKVLEAEEFERTFKQIRKKYGPERISPLERDLALFDLEDFQVFINESTAPKDLRKYVAIHQATKLLNLYTVNRRRLRVNLNYLSHLRGVKEEYRAAHQDNKLEEQHKFMVEFAKNITKQYSLDERKTENSIKKREQIFKEVKTGQEEWGKKMEKLVMKPFLEKEMKDIFKKIIPVSRRVDEESGIDAIGVLKDDSHLAFQLSSLTLDRRGERILSEKEMRKSFDPIFVLGDICEESGYFPSNPEEKTPAVIIQFEDEYLDEAQRKWRVGGGKGEITLDHFPNEKGEIEKQKNKIHNQMIEGLNSALFLERVEERRNVLQSRLKSLRI